MPRTAPPPRRKHPTHQAFIERRNQLVIVFLTVCSAQRKAIFANASAAATLVNAWGRADAWRVGRYVIMPDHLHLFCSPLRGDVSLPHWVQFWKSEASRHWPSRTDHPLWQRDFWDTQLRRADDYDVKLEYVRFNPVRYGLVTHPDAWPYQGELNVLSWDRK